MRTKIEYLFLLPFLIIGSYCPAQTPKPVDETLRANLGQLLEPFQGTVGISILEIEGGDTLTLNNGLQFPMQSVYKFPLALAILHQVDAKRLSLQQKVRISKADLKPDTWSPLQKLHPNGNVDLTVGELLEYTVAQSDNNTCDVLFRLMEGPKKVEKYIHKLGYKNISIKTTEAEMAVNNDSIQKMNWCHPAEMTRLLRGFYQNKHLTASSYKFLLRLMTESSNSPKRLKGLLPASTVVAHKTGTGNQVVNDVGIITLPNGHHLAIAVFIRESREPLDKSEALIAAIAKTTFDYFRSEASLKNALEALVKDGVGKPFNGVVLLDQAGRTVYSKTEGYADLDQKTAVNSRSQFIVGSISKQFTAVMVLQEFEKGRLQLDAPIKKYLPDLKKGWADTVTVHHLLTHMHGISGQDNPLKFKPGTQFDYGLSDMGYRLLSRIVEQTSGKSFVQLSKALFESCGMKDSYHPDLKKYKNLAKGYTEQKNGTMKFESNSFQNSAAAGGFISTAQDLVLWNANLHGGKLLKPETYQLMMSKKDGALRDHAVFGPTTYGYGITIEDKPGLLRLGQTGFSPGYVSMDFYFPASKTSLIVLENYSYFETPESDPNALRKKFDFHTTALKLVSDYLMQSSPEIQKN